MSHNDRPTNCDSCGRSLVSFSRKKLEDGICPYCSDPIQVDDCDTTDAYPDVTSESMHGMGYEITIQRKPHLKAKFRVEEDEIYPLIEELKSIREGS